MSYIFILFIHHENYELSLLLVLEQIVLLGLLLFKPNQRHQVVMVTKQSSCKVCVHIGHVHMQATSSISDDFIFLNKLTKY